jgi:hypothetical protein
MLSKDGDPTMDNLAAIVGVASRAAQVLPAHDLAEGLENRLVAVVPRPQQLVLVEEVELHA